MILGGYQIVDLTGVTSGSKVKGLYSLVKICEKPILVIGADSSKRFAGPYAPTFGIVDLYGSEIMITLPRSPRRGENLYITIATNDTVTFSLS